MTYKDPEYLYEQHWDEGKSLRKIGEKHDVSHKTISYWFEKFDLPKRGVGGKLPYVPFKTASELSGSAGYELWRCGTGEARGKRIRVHRLVAVAEYGFDAVKDMHVHHDNEFKMDNRPENLELLTNEEHARLHSERRASA